MLHDNPMRFLPLLPSSLDPAPWMALAPLMLQWDGGLHRDWQAAARRGLAIHGVFLRAGFQAAEALEVLGLGLDLDFLVLPLQRPEGREAGFRLLGLLETLLEATAGRGVKLALQLEPGSETAVLELLRQAHGEAVGYCWHPGLRDPEPLADRLWCASCVPGTDLAPLQALGYRWDMALAAEDPDHFQAQAAALASLHPPVLFPAAMPDTVLGRPVVPDDSLVFGRHWDREGEVP